MKREVRNLLTRSTDSVLLAIEHFNRPWDRGRHEAVLILLGGLGDAREILIFLAKGRGQVLDNRDSPHLFPDHL